MRIGIVGGGISGLYLARLLKQNHDVTVFESNTWGGDIQHEHVNDKCYPISTLFAMPGDTLLKHELKRLDIKTRPLHPPLIGDVTAFMIVIIGLVKVVPNKKALTLIIGLLVFTFLHVINRKVCHTILAFGCDKDCRALYKFRTYLGGVSDILFKPLLYMQNCGPSTIVQSYLKDNGITYRNKKVVHISRNEGGGCTLSIEDGQMISFDKCIITTPYESYKDIIALSDDEVNVLSGTEYFDFYSTLIMTSNTRNVTGSIGSFEIEDGVHLFASHHPIDVKPGSYTFKKTYKWRMPIVYDKWKRQQVNSDVGRSVFFAGKELSGNGVNHCMKYAMALSQLLNP